MDTHTIYLNSDCDYQRPFLYDCFLNANYNSTEPIDWKLTFDPADRDIEFIWDEYEHLDWKNILQGKVYASSYCIRKGLSRKAQLSIYLGKYIQKHPNCLLKQAIPYTLIIDTWEAYSNSTELGYIPFHQRLENCLWKVQQQLNTTTEQVWILKPSATNKGAEVNVIRTYDELKDIIFQWTDIREWVIQHYIARPLLFRQKKFHVRTYVLAIGALTVYVFQPMLLLTAMNPYHETDLTDLSSHITNTSYQEHQSHFDPDACIYSFDELPKASTYKAQINALVSEVFDAYVNEFAVFQPLSNCFELYGFDFLIDTSHQVWLLEANPGPDLKQTGTTLNHMIYRLIQDTMHLTMQHFYSIPPQSTAYQKVFDHQQGFRATSTVNMQFT